MFGLFKNKGPECPIDPEQRLWMENAFLWLLGQFGEEYIFKKEVLVPSKTIFPFRYDGSGESLVETAKIVAEQMDIDFNEIDVKTFKENIREIRMGDLGHRLYTEVHPEDKMAAGLFFDKNEDGKYEILVEEQQLLDPEGLVATLAHEFSHIKLLGEKRIDFNDEYLTDLLTVVFGLGVFNSNAYFRFQKIDEGWRHATTGYMNQQEWGYALALFAWFREEEEHADWLPYLDANLRSDYRKSIAFIKANQDRIFREEYLPGEPGQP